MQQLLYADEVRPFSEVPLDSAEVKEAELKLARMLVQESASDAFQPEAYEDDVKKRIQEALDRKVKGGNFKVSAPPNAGRRDRGPDGRPARVPRPRQEERGQVGARRGAAQAGESVAAPRRWPAGQRRW